MLGSYFYNESLRKCIIAFGSLFNDIYITRKTAAGVEAQTLKVPLAYGPKQKFMVRLDPPPNLDKALIHMSTQYTPVPYNVNFELFVMTKNSDDGIQIVEQILPFFQPEYTVTINEVPEMAVIRDVPIVLNSIGYEDTYTGSFTERRAIIYTFNFVAKAYVYGPVTTSKPITKVEATAYADLQDKAPPRVARVTQQAVGSPDADDNFGFNETVSEWIDG